MLRYCFVFIVFTALTISLLPLQLLAAQMQRWWHKSLPLFWHKCMCRLFGIRVKTKGNISKERPLLLIANHVSWSDINVLGSQAELSFIAKDEIKHWPLFGLFAKLQHTIFIDRKTKQKSGAQSKVIAERLRNGDALVLFAEGTTSDGNSVFPFKSSLFGAAKMALSSADKDAKVFVQPVSIAYARRHGIPLGRYHRQIVAWPGTVGFAKHFKDLVRARSLGVDVTFGEAIVFDHDTNRKDLAQIIHRQVKSMMHADIHGRASSMQDSQFTSNVEAKPLNGQP